MSRDDLIYKAKVAEQAERYDEMVEAVKSLVDVDAALSLEERNLLSVAYKNVVGSRRTAWRILHSIEQHTKDMEAKGSGEHIPSYSVQHVQTYKFEVEKELKDLCNDALTLVEKKLIPSSANNESKVFFWKMKGDYHRYLAEVVNSKEDPGASENSLLAYKQASDIALAELAATHPTRLGLALNFSVFYFEVLDSPERACELAKQAYEDATSSLDTADEDTYKDSTLILQLIRDNLTLWNADLAKPPTQDNGAVVQNLEDDNAA